MKINIHKFYEQFAKEYKFLYENDNVCGYEEAVNAFDENLKNEEFAKFVGEFCKFRQDLIASDREAGAFMFALEAMAN